MGSEDGLVEIEPGELQFVFEVQKQSSCSVHLMNKTEDYVAFKVKTTSPKRYCVRPNIGVILPRATCLFTVTMQAQRTAPPDLQIKDKFLVQTTVVPFGTTVEGIVPAFFSKESRRYIKENKLRVVLVSATQSESEQHISGVTNAKTAVEVPPVAKETLNTVNEVTNVVNEDSRPLKASFPPPGEIPAILSEIPVPVKGTPIVLRDFPVPSKESPATSTEHALHLKESPAASAEYHFSSTETSFTSKETPPPLEDNSGIKEVVILGDALIDAKNIQLSHVEDVQNLKSKLSNLEVKLEEAENLIRKLREETRHTTQERDKLRHDVVFMKRKGGLQSQARFPLLFVVYMAILGASLGYLLHI